MEVVTLFLITWRMMYVYLFIWSLVCWKVRDGWGFCWVVNISDSCMLWIDDCRLLEKGGLLQTLDHLRDLGVLYFFWPPACRILPTEPHTWRIPTACTHYDPSDTTA